MNIGPLAKIDDVSVADVMIGFPLALERGEAEPLFRANSKGATEFQTSLKAKLVDRLSKAGIRVSDTSENGIGVNVFGGKFKTADCPSENFFMLAVWVSPAGAERGSAERTVLGVVTDADLAEELTKAALVVIDEFLSQRKASREPKH